MIIALIGYKRSGKDTLASYIASTEGFKHLKIASKLKELTSLLFGFDSENEKEVINTKWGISPRQAMQFIGTEMFQYKIQELIPDIGRSFWIRSFISANDMSEDIVISDMRFVHEYTELIKNAEVYVIKIIRADIVQEDLHSSETEFNNIPVNLTLFNNDLNFTNNLPHNIRSYLRKNN